MTYYEKLGLNKNATQKEIKEAHKNLVKKYHPDVYTGDKSYAEKITKEINVAYDILSNPIKKAKYDEEINPPTYTYNPPTYNYSYTPPKYDRPPSNYNDYRKTYSKDYNYNYRYQSTNYNKNESRTSSQTQNSNYSNSNYSNSNNSVFEDKFIKIFDTNKLVVIFLIFIIYIALLIFTFSQFYAFKNNKYKGTIINTQKVEEENTTADETNTTINKKSTNTNTNKNTSDYNTSNDNPYNDFDINDYVSNSELYDIYLEYFYNDFETFSDFKEAISKEFYDYYYSELY